ncbi:hypothetical protein NUU61_009478 [Penicillium alfredii]|uniref:Uncharacterized protein n=1 Tax=Penicillium alfredii TaxID=1506179 RepID=A0A9W9JWX8_9EURO|nr:uncharacterized protein NUU61_009478 [Penicillium alfredii]KAJ5084899.1 hypothetical protein NUU61_009478 [Penicillium alfredii]
MDVLAYPKQFSYGYLASESCAGHKMQVIFALADVFSVFKAPVPTTSNLGLYNSKVDRQAQISTIHLKQINLQVGGATSR